MRRCEMEAKTGANWGEIGSLGRDCEIGSLALGFGLGDFGGGEVGLRSSCELRGWVDVSSGETGRRGGLVGVSSGDTGRRIGRWGGGTGLTGGIGGAAPKCAETIGCLMVRSK